MNEADDELHDVTDDADKVWIDSVLPEGCVALAFIGIIRYANPDGGTATVAFAPMQSDIDVMLGMLRRAEIELWGDYVGDPDD